MVKWGMSRLQITQHYFTNINSLLAHQVDQLAGYTWGVGEGTRWTMKTNPFPSSAFPESLMPLPARDSCSTFIHTQPFAQKPIWHPLPSPTQYNWTKISLEVGTREGGEGEAEQEPRSWCTWGEPREDRHIKWKDLGTVILILYKETRNPWKGRKDKWAELFVGSLS